MVSDGGTRPYRVHFRDPSFTNLQAVAAMCEGGTVADVITAVASIDPVMEGGPMTDQVFLGSDIAVGHNNSGPKEPAARELPVESAITFGGPDHYPDDVLARLTDEATEIIARYPQSRSALLPLLHLTQSVDSYITRAGIEFCAAQLHPDRRAGGSGGDVLHDVPAHPTGEYLVGVCTNTLCAVLGGDEILRRKGTPRNRVRRHHSRRRITLEHVECNAACDHAPVVMVNWEFFDAQGPGVDDRTHRGSARGPESAAVPRHRRPVLLPADRTTTRRGTRGAGAVTTTLDSTTAEAPMMPVC